MANYDAQINILVGGQRNITNLANQLNAIEDSISEIERRWRSASGALQRANIRLGVIGTQQPRGEGGRFASDPDRRARQAAFADRRRALVEQRLARLSSARQRASAAAAGTAIDSNRELIRQAERRITLESRLNAANELFQRKVQQFSRGGAGRGLPENLQQQVRSIQAAYDAAGGAGSRNLRLVQSLATELGRVVERQNEFNRLQSLGSKGFEAGRRLQERISAASSRADLPAQRVRSARSLATEVITASRSGDQQAYSEAVRRATAATSRLERESKELADAINEQENEIRRIARIAPRSPVRGGRNFPGSPIAEEIALREAQKGFPASPIMGTATMAGSPKAEKVKAKAEKTIAEATGILGGAAQRLVGIENRTELASAIDEYLAGLNDVELNAEKLLKKNAKSLSDFNQRLKERDDFQRSREKAIADAWKMRGGPALPTGFTEAGVVKQKGVSVDIGAQRRLQSVLASGSIIEQGLINLRAKGADVSRELIDLQQALNTAKQKDYVISENTLDVLASQVSLAGKFAQLQRTILAGQGGGGRGGKASPESTGLENALKRLEEARGARQKFLGGASPAQAIDQIVREFNKGASGGGAGQVAENVADTYALGIKAGIPAVAQAMMNLGKAGIDAIKKALGIASPSRVMLAIAKNQVDTYVDFLRAALPVVEAVAKSLGEAGTPNVSGVPESAIRKPITEKARTRPLTAEQLDRNSAIAEYAASQIAGPMGQFEQVKRKIEDFIDKTRTSVDLDKLFGGQEDERFAMATRGKSAGPEFDKIRAALADFYQVPAELTPDLERGVKSASEASVSADELTKYVSELTSGIEQIGVLLQSAAKLPAPAVVVDNEFTRAQQAAAEADAAAAETARRKAEAQKPFEASIQRAAELDAEAKRKADAAVSSVVQAQIEADARAGAEAISKAILDPIESAAPEGERQVRSAIGNLFDRVAGALGFGGGGGGGRPPVPPTGGGGPTRDPRDFNRRLSTAAEQGAEALLGLQELRDPTKAATVELEALSGVLKEFRKILDPTAEGFERLEKQLRESAANLDRQIERRAPDAGFLTRRLGPRTARGLSEGLIGGAFPLLFGQGIGAAVGGGAGGFAGGFAGGGLGFGLSLVGTALGTAFDTAVQGATELGAALNEASETFDKVKERSLFASKEVEKLAGKAQEFGLVATANVLAQQAVIEKIGTSGAQSLKNLATSSDKLNRAWAEFNLQLQAALAGPMAGLLEWVTEIVKRINNESRTLADVKDTIEGLPANKREEFVKRNAQIGVQRGGFAIQGLRDLGINIGISPEEASKQRQNLIEEFAQFVVPVKVKPTIEQIEEQKLSLLGKELEVIDIARPFIDAARNANREQQDLDKQRADLVRSYEENIGNIRKQIEDEVRNRRLAVLETENQILDQQGQNRISQLRLINQQLVASAGEGQRSEVEDAAKRAAQIVAQFTEQQLSAEEEAAQVKRNAALDALKFDTQAIEFKANIEKEVSRLNIETARRVADINEQVRRRNQDFDARRFELEKQIAEIKLAAIGRQVSALNIEALAYSDPNIQNKTDALVKNIVKLQNQIATLEAPAPLRGIPEGSIGGQGVPTGQLEAVIGQQKDRAQKLVNEILAGLNFTKLADIESFKNQVADLAKSFNAPITAFAQNFNDQLQASARYIQLINQGMKGTTAEQVIQIEQAREIAIAQYNQSIQSLETRKNAKETTEAAKGIIESQIVDLQNARDALINAASAAINKVALNESIISAREAMKAMREEMNNLLDKVNQAKFASETFGQGIAGGITGSLSALTKFDTIKERRDLRAEIDQLEKLKEGARGNTEAVEEYTKKIAEARAEWEKLNDTGTRVQEVVSNMLSKIGESFLEMAQKIIAQQITMIIFGTILKALGIAAGSSGGGGGGTPGVDVSPQGQIAPLPIAGAVQAANGSYFANGIAAFANGGMFTNSVVSSPTLFKFADGGAMRTGVMGEAGPEAIMPLSRGSDGRLGVDANGLREAMSASGGSSSTPMLNMTFETTSINGVEYVSREQLETAMAATRRQAAKDGARQGMNMTLDRLQQSPKTRSRVGLR